MATTSSGKIASAPNSNPANSHASGKSQRVLACVLCQQRKIKCDRKFPCAICRKAGVPCVPAALIPRQRRRRFAERELLDRLRHYEDLLRQNDIPFEPLHPQSSTTSNKGSPSNSSNVVESPDNALEETQADKMKSKTYSIWRAMNQEEEPEGDLDDSQSDSDLDHFIAFKGNVRPKYVREVWTRIWDNNDHLFFGPCRTNVPLTPMHPPSASIFRLWQIFCDNVVPLLKVVHVPTLQQKIINAVGNLAVVDASLEALMFSIYAAATRTLDEGTCQATFGASKQDLLLNYQFACWQALSSCGVLRSLDLEPLTALVLYLISAKPDVDPASLSCMLGVAVRMAQRIGIHREVDNLKKPPLEAELRRRLWWALVMFDGRICELSVFASSSFDPIADCKIPANVNDQDLCPEMKAAPESYDRPTDAIFTVVRSQVGDFIRNSHFYTDFAYPMYRQMLRKAQSGVTASEVEELAALEKFLEEQYLRSLDPSIPLHFMTIWNTRCQMAKMFILEQYAVQQKRSATQTNEQRDIAMAYAVRMLEADTQLRSSSKTRGFLWFLNFYMPAMAYFHAANDLKKRPLQVHADQTWDALDQNYQAHFIHGDSVGPETPFVKLLDGLIWQAWEAREVALGTITPKPPIAVTMIRDRMMVNSAAKMNLEPAQPQPPPAMPSTMAFGGSTLTNNMMGALPDVFGQAVMDLNMSGDQTVDWSGFDW